MSMQWILQKQEKLDGGFTLRLGLKAAGREQTVLLEPECTNPSQMQEMSREIIRSLQAKVEEAEQIWEQAEQEQEDADQDPEQIWQRMQSMQEEEMLELFNALDPELRNQVAEHILTTASMFKGAGARFAARYDALQGKMA